MPAYKDDGRWRYRFVKNGQRYSGSTPKGANTKRAAEALERAHADSIITGLKPGQAAPHVRDFAEQFLAYQRAVTKPLTQRQQEATVRNHIIPELGGLRLDAIRKAQVDALVMRWSETLAPKTINSRLGTLRRMLSLANEWEIIPGVPKFKFLKIGKTKPRFLSDSEAQRLVAACDEHWRSMVFVALRTGLRVGELRGLQWGDVSFSRRLISVRRTDPGLRGAEPTTPKGSNEREVPLTPEAFACLSGLYSQGKKKPADWVWPAPRWRGAKTDKTRSESGCQHAIERAAVDAGLEDVGWHTLRHTYASHLVMRGVPLRQIQKWLGHSSIAQTEVYSHLSPEFGHQAAALLDTPLAPDQDEANQKQLHAGSDRVFEPTPDE